MFQFTTTNVLNSNLWHGEEGRYAQVTENGKNALFVKGVGTFRADNVVSIYKAEPVEAEYAEATINLGTITDAKEGDVYRIDIYLGLSQGSQYSMYANDLIYKGKPLSVEFAWRGTADATGQYIADKIFRNYLADTYYDRLLKVDHKGGVLTIKATDEYQRFRKLELQKFDADAYRGMGEFVTIASIADESDNGVVLVKEGKESFGTYSFLLHNLRIPTSSRTHFAAINQEESPIPGVKYTQFTIHYCVNRGILGTNAVGDLVKSATTHVFYVAEDYVTEFETLLADLASVVTVSADGKKVEFPVSSDSSADSTEDSGSADEPEDQDEP